MPQIFQVLRCFKCLVFQVHQTKKSNKWECKLCGEKQSVKRHYGLGTGKDCRIHVQKLNGMRGEINELKFIQDQESDNSENEYNDVTQITKKNAYQPIKDSKWSNFVEETKTVEENSNENMLLGDAEVVLEIPQKRRKLYKCNSKRIPKVITTADYKYIQENFKNEAPPDANLIEAHNTITLESKISQQDFSSNDLAIEKECLNVSRQSIKNKFIPPVLNKNSKWAEFTEDTEECEETSIITSQNIDPPQNDLLFSLCDDSDLDNVLDI